MTTSTNDVEKETLLHQPNLGPKEGCPMENSTQNSVSFKKKKGRKSEKCLENWVKKLTKAKKGKLANAQGQNGNNASQNDLQHQICKIKLYYWPYTIVICSICSRNWRFKLKST